MDLVDLYEEIKKNFITFEALFTQEELSEFKNTPMEKLYLYHYGFGTWIRNNLLYSADSMLFDLFIKCGFAEPDDMSLFIICNFHNYVFLKNCRKIYRSGF